MEKRRFGLPVGIALACNAAILFGFRTPDRMPAKNTCVICPVHSPIVVHDEPADTESLDNQSGGPGRPDIGPANPVVSPFTIEERSAPQPYLSPDTRIVPAVSSLGPGLGVGPHNGPIDVSRLDRTPVVKLRVPPAYPTEAKYSGEIGTVNVEFLVDVSGRVREARVLSSTDPVFNAPTLRAIGQWRFEPGRFHGQLVAFRMAIPIEFNLAR